jgi:hypothetical protein
VGEKISCTVQTVEGSSHSFSCVVGHGRTSPVEAASRLWGLGLHPSPAGLFLPVLLLFRRVTSSCIKSKNLPDCGGLHLYPGYPGRRDQEDHDSKPAEFEKPYLKNTQHSKIKGWQTSSSREHLPSKYEALSSNPGKNLSSCLQEEEEHHSELQKKDRT